MFERWLNYPSIVASNMFIGITILHVTPFHVSLTINNRQKAKKWHEPFKAHLTTFHSM